jgi:hypothetical protein
MDRLVEMLWLHQMCFVPLLVSTHLTRHFFTKIYELHPHFVVGYTMHVRFVPDIARKLLMCSI